MTKAIKFISVGGLLEIKSLLLCLEFADKEVPLKQQNSYE